MSEAGSPRDPLQQRAAEAARAFRLAGPVSALARFGSGHIHDTYAVRCQAPGGALRYVLQRINATVFPEPERVVENAVRVSEHLRARLAGRGPDARRGALTWCETHAGGALHRDADGGVWRASLLIERTHTRDAPASPEQAASVGRAFGEFLDRVSDLDPASLREAIPGFRDLARYARRFEAAVAADAFGRLRGCAGEVEAARRAWARLGGDAGAPALPLRVIHADCKINNVLLDDASGVGVCVIDLDTVMPGHAADDFGQLVRSATCAAAEDERELSRVRFDLELFEALSRGFVAGVGARLSAAERESLRQAGPRSALEHVLRFLADHLAGDRYFRVHRDGQNLDRARSQQRLLEEMLAHAREVEATLRALG